MTTVITRCRHQFVQQTVLAWDIFRFPSGPQRGLSVWKQKGAEAYVTYHNAIYATGKNEGNLTKEDIDLAAAKAGWRDSGKESFTSALEKNDALAKALSLTGTPGIIIMPVTGATPKNITVIPGAVPAERLEAAINKASVSP